MNNEQIPAAVPGLCFTFKIKVPEPPTISATAPQRPASSVLLPFDTIKSMLSGKQVMRPNAHRHNQSL